MAFEYWYDLCYLTNITYMLSFKLIIKSIIFLFKKQINLNQYSL